MKLINPSTGEILQGLAVPPKKKFNEQVQTEGFNTMFMFGWDYFSEAGELTGTDFRVLSKLITHMEYENWIKVSHQRIADELNLKRQNVSRSFKKLVELDILEKHPDPNYKGRFIYRLNPSLGWRGDTKNWKKVMADRKESNIIPIK